MTLPALTDWVHVHDSCGARDKASQVAAGGPHQEEEGQYPPL